MTDTTLLVDAPDSLDVHSKRKPLPRITATYENLSAPFVINPRDFTQQYAALYYCRLRALRGPTLRTARGKWGELEMVEGIKDLPSETECAVCGVLYKDMVLKPSVLQQYMENLAITAPVKSFLSDSDHLYLEDEASRIALVPQKGDHLACLPVQKLVTGMVVAVRGRQLQTGEFEVVQWAFADALSIPMPPLKSTPRRVALVSGLDIGSSSMNAMRLTLLRNFLLGGSGSETDRELSSSIVRLVVAGNSIGSCDQASPTTTSTTKNKGRVQDLSTKCVEAADVFFAHIASALPIDVMPGAKDPATGSLPQQPLHPALFPNARRLSTFRSTTNPYFFSLDGLRFLGFSGQTVANVMDFTSIESELETLQTLVESRCMAPTCPDTLPCYPFTMTDPFCLADEVDKSPHVVFSGNSSALAFARMGQTNQKGRRGRRKGEEGALPLCVCIPSFSSEGVVVLVDLNTLEVEEVVLEG